MVPAVRQFLDFLGENTRGEGYPVAADPAASI
jgi:hypothetical protein